MAAVWINLPECKVFNLLKVKSECQIKKVSGRQQTSFGTEVIITFPFH